MIGQLGDVDHTVLTGSQLHKSAELEDADHLAVVELATSGTNTMVSMVFLAASQEALSVPGNVDGAVVLDVDLGAGVGTDLLDDLAAGAR